MSNSTTIRHPLNVAIMDGLKAAFKAGFQRGKEHAIDRCEIERRGAGNFAYNSAIDRCIEAINALDVRHTPEVLKYGE